MIRSTLKPSSLNTRRATAVLMSRIIFSGNLGERLDDWIGDVANRDGVLSDLARWYASEPFNHDVSGEAHRIPVEGEDIRSHTDQCRQEA